MMETNERWKPIKGHEGYLISDHGHAKNGRFGRMMRPCLTSSGYLYIKCGDKNICIHKAVANAFLPKPEHGAKRLVIHHKDGNKGNNHYTNLIWLSDIEHSEMHHISEIMSEKQKQKIVGKDENGNITVWESIADAQAFFGVSKDQFIFAYLWDTTIKDPHGMTWEINRVLEIQDGNGKTKWETPRTTAQTKAERRVLDAYIKKTLGD